MSQPRTAVAEYYDENTRPFLNFFGSGTGVAAIHRQLWGPGVKTEREAFEFLNQLILDEILGMRGEELGRVLDLGCGIGGTATWLAQRSAAQIFGITISEVQAQLATERARQLGVAAQCEFAQGDFLNLPEAGPFAAAYAIESFIHAEDPARFFTEAARVLAPGARLVICDDFLATNALPPEAERWLNLFQSGWHLANLKTVPAAQKHASAAGLRFLTGQPLSQYLRPVPEWVVQAGTALLNFTPKNSKYWQSLRGSTALQKCIRAGWTEYHALVWEKP
ncbi:MAG: methyltransferase domain-containing protein [Anaerolineales bacterium]|nr:methyltransferase domain-containing protein [Anaerolineales bacterium]